MASPPPSPPPPDWLSLTMHTAPEETAELPPPVPADPGTPAEAAQLPPPPPQFAALASPDWLSLSIPTAPDETAELPPPVLADPGTPAEAAEVPPPQFVELASPVWLSLTVPMAPEETAQSSPPVPVDLETPTEATQVPTPPQFAALTPPDWLPLTMQTALEETPQRSPPAPADPEKTPEEEAQVRSPQPPPPKRMAYTKPPASSTPEGTTVMGFPVLRVPGGSAGATQSPQFAPPPPPKRVACTNRFGTAYPIGTRIVSLPVRAAQVAAPRPANPSAAAAGSASPVPTRPMTPGFAAQTARPVFTQPGSSSAGAPRMVSPTPRMPGFAAQMARPVFTQPGASSAGPPRMVAPPSRRPTTPAFTQPGTSSPGAARTSSVPTVPVCTRPTVPAAAAQLAQQAFPRPGTPVAAAAAAARMVPPVPKWPVNTRPASAAQKVWAPTEMPVSANPTTPAQTMPPPPKRTVSANPTALASSAAKEVEVKEKNAPSVLKMGEVDPRTVKPDVLRAIREKNMDILSVVLDPRRDCTKSITPANDDEWFVSKTACHHISGNLDLLSNLSPVSNRWVGFEPGKPLQALARGFVNCDGIILDDVWYIPRFLNIVSVSHLAQQGLQGEPSTDAWTFKRFDGSVAGRARAKTKTRFLVEFINTSTSHASEAAWYLLSSAQEHMTGNLELLTNYKPMRPSRAVRTHTGVILQVCGKGSLECKKLFSVPDISYVPGLDKNIISVSQLTDSGFIVDFGPNGCSIKRCNSPRLVLVGQASYGGEELFRLSSLSLNLKYEEPVQVPESES